MSITRLPVLEGEVSHIEIPRFSPSLGITIVGGSDTALACMALRKPKSQVLRLGVYRERVAPYSFLKDSQNVLVRVVIEHAPRQALGIRLSGSWGDDFHGGVYITEIVPGSPAALTNLLCPLDSILYVNDQDVANCHLQQVSTLLQSTEKVSLVVSRKVNSPLGSNPRPKSAPESLDLDSTVSQASNPPWGLKSVFNDSLTLPTPTTPRHLATTNLNRDFSEPLQYKFITIVKEANESLGMRIGGGISSNEGDIPIYIANIHPQGCVGKTQRIWKGDILIAVNGNSLIGLSHAQAVATLKTTIPNTRVEITVVEGPETSLGAMNFVPTWLYWQKLPRCLQFPKTVTLYRSPGASLGFSIVGGEDPSRGSHHIHILFVVQNSPAARDGNLRCGDRVLSVDGQSLDKVEHSKAVSMLKKTGTKVVLEVVSWLGTEI